MLANLRRIGIPVILTDSRGKGVVDGQTFTRNEALELADLVARSRCDDGWYSVARLKALLPTRVVADRAELLSPAVTTPPL